MQAVVKIDWQPNTLMKRVKGKTGTTFDSPKKCRYVLPVTFRSAEFSPRAARVGFGASPCPHFPNCFGCPFINLPYPEQLTRKREIVTRALSAYPVLQGVEVPPVVPSPRRLGYRARVKLVVRKNKGDVAIGLYVPQSHRVMDISSCPVHPRPVNQVLQNVKRKILELGIIPYDERDDTGDLRYVDFRYSFARRELSLTLVTRR